MELKCVDALTSVHQAQLMTYMKLANAKTGFLINFNLTLLKNGLKRIVLCPFVIFVVAITSLGQALGQAGHLWISLSWMARCSSALR